MDKDEAEMSEEFYSYYSSAPIFLAIVTDEDASL